MKRTVLALILGALPASTAAAGEIDVGIEVRTAHARVAVATNNGGSDSVWVPGRWENHGGRWVYREGYWHRVEAPPPAPVYHTAEPVEVVYAEMPPPAPMVEVRPVAPYAHAVWIPGHWRWHGRRYVWIAGRWDAPRPGYVWEAPRWSRHGGRWASHPGAWRRAHDHHDRGHGRGHHRDRDDRRHHGHHGRRHHRH